jgi:hypothetical protein
MLIWARKNGIEFLHLADMVKKGLILFYWALKLFGNKICNREGQLFLK